MGIVATMRFDVRPPFVPESIVGASLNFPWKGARDHIGPVETVTPLFERLGSTTTCGQLSICAGVLLWGAWRLKGHTPVEHNMELAEASFAYQVDWRYLDVSAGPKGKAPDQPPEVSAMMKLNSYMRSALTDYWINYYIPLGETFHSAHIVKHILPKPAAKSFQEWLVALADRVKTIAAAPDEPLRKRKEFATEEAWEEFLAPHRGQPLPPDILNPDSEVTEESRPRLVTQFFEQLDFKRNRYLRSPEKMLELGFTGTPYRL